MKNTNKRGVTLIALVITIIVLLILTGVAITALIGENNLITKAKQAKEKSINAEENENVIIDSYEREIGKYTIGTSDEKVNESEVVSSVNLTIKSIGTKSFECEVNAQCNNAEDIADYHIYIENLNNFKRTVCTGKESVINVDNLEPNTKYRIYAIVCDVYGKFRKTGNIEIQTLDAEPLVIDKVQICNPYWGKYSVDASGCTEILFNKIINESSMPYGGILMAGGDYIEITVNKNIKIYAYGYNYSDGGGRSGKPVIIKRLNNNIYEDYKTVDTDATNNKYELVTLESGKYRIYIQSNYVNFTEWEVETIN